jgi:hypothetical protein
MAGIIGKILERVPEIWYCKGTKNIFSKLTANKISQSLMKYMECFKVQ